MLEVLGWAGPLFAGGWELEGGFPVAINNSGLFCLHCLLSFINFCGVTFTNLLHHFKTYMFHMCIIIIFTG